MLTTCALDAAMESRLQGQKPVTKLQLSAGDSLLLTGGGHGFTVLEACQLIEVKQGPYLGMDDKVKFG